MDRDLFIGVDVGTASARAGVFDDLGSQLATSSHPIKVSELGNSRSEQSSIDIWQAVCKCVQGCISEVRLQYVECVDGAIDPALRIRGIGFDATCSLVVVPSGGTDMSAWFSEDNDIVMWKDHRATEECQKLNDTLRTMRLKQHPLANVGGKINVEMQVPKLMWLKNHERHGKGLSTVNRLFDLSDWLVWRATGKPAQDIRSVCSTVCKWTYAYREGWQSELFGAVGLESLCEDNFYCIGSHVVDVGKAVDALSPDVIREWDLSFISDGLQPGIVVSSGIIDAHSGVLGTLGMGANPDIRSQLSMICGTSACHMALNDQKCLVPGVWGPYESVILPGYFLAEGGQSAAGPVLDEALKNVTLVEESPKGGCDIPCSLEAVHEFITKTILERCEQADCYGHKQYSRANESDGTFEQSTSKPIIPLDCDDLYMDMTYRHTLPFMNGSRLYADTNIIHPHGVGVGSATVRIPRSDCAAGTSLTENLKHILTNYILAIQSVAYEAYEILERLREHGYNKLRRVHMCGGLSRNPLYVQIHADVLDMEIWVIDSEIKDRLPVDPVLLGGAILGAAASGRYPSLEAACRGMRPKVCRVVKSRPRFRKWHDARFQVFKKMRIDQMEYREIMNRSIGNS